MAAVRPLASVALASVATALVLLGSAPALEADERLLPREILAVMASRRAQIRKVCWEDREPKQETSLRVDIVVAPAGVVTEATARETSGSTAIVECVVAEVRKTVFPKTEKGGQFRWPFIFKGP
jgi:hypothetical protein